MFYINSDAKITKIVYQRQRSNPACYKIFVSFMCSGWNSVVNFILLNVKGSPQSREAYSVDYLTQVIELAIMYTHCNYI